MACRRSSFIIIAGVAGLLCLAGCQTARIPRTGLKVPVPSLSFIGLPWPGLGEGNLTGLSYENAFLAMKGRMQREYPFTEWKGIDWDALDARFRPRIKAAQDARDAEAFYLAMREFLYAIPDGHLGISDAPDYRKHAIGGGFGFAVARLDDGRVIVRQLDPQSEAAKAGMKLGAEVLAWNGGALAETAARVSVLWASEPPATAEVRVRDQYRLLTRGPVGATAKVTFQNPGDPAPTEAALTAYDDDYRSLELASSFEEAAHAAAAPFEFTTLDGGIAYVKVMAVGATLAVPFPERAFAKGIGDFVESGAPGLVLDLRRNSGGSDALAARLCAHFVSEGMLLRHIEKFVAKDVKFVRDSDETLRVSPNEPHFAGPIVVLIDSNTLDAAEGIVAALKRLPNVRTVGEESTHGAYALTGGGMELPGGHTVFYPVGRAVDDDGKILIESDRDSKGGIAPDVRVPLTRETILQRYEKGEDVILAAGLNALREMLPGDTAPSGGNAR
jgi:carboxyl-terminal processing protease